MDLDLTWASLLCSLIMQMSCVPYLSKQDRALLSDEPNPKCFTTDFTDFTCFWESLGEKSFEFIYKVDDNTTCNLTQQETEAGKVLHICFFPPADVFIFAPVDIKVMDKDTNLTIYSRSLQVEEQVLLNPPSNISLHPTGEAGQMQVKCHVRDELYIETMLYELRCSSDTLQDKVVQLKSSKCEHELSHLVPGQMCTLQMRVKPGLYGGHWSDWSAPVSAIVPQSADDLELQCHTPDLHQIQCRWNEGLYGDTKLHYKQKSRDLWGNWKICEKKSAPGKPCVLYGEEQTMFEVYVTAQLEHYTRTFYMNQFMMKKSSEEMQSAIARMPGLEVSIIKKSTKLRTDAPQGLKEKITQGRLCLSWICPLPQISKHMMYQVHYQLQEETEWKFFTVESAKTRACLDVQVSGQYAIKVKATPNGTFYSGYWSAWSKTLMVQLPSNTGLLFIAIIIPSFLLIGSVAFIVTFPRYAGKLKRFLWPPVPDLNDMLESFLKDISGQDWEPKISNKLCDDDVPASVLEIMPSKEFQIKSKLASLTDLGTGEHHTNNMSREYVTLKTNNALMCPTGNDYVYTVSDRLEGPPCCSSHAFPASTNLLNHSYLQAELGSLHGPTGYSNLE